MHRTTTTNTTSEEPSTLAALRALIPIHALSFAEALRIAELQANRLLELSGRPDEPSADQWVAGLPRIRIQYQSLPTSGLSYWDGHNWVVGINRTEPATRQRFTLLHEFKHIIDHGRTANLYQDDVGRGEQVADYFAGCALMPKRLVKRAWGNGMQHPRDLARAFEVSERAVEVRLAQLGLSDRDRCAPPIRSVPRGRPGRYYRQTWSVLTHELIPKRSTA